MIVRSWWPGAVLGLGILVVIAAVVVTGRPPGVSNSALPGASVSIPAPVLDEPVPAGYAGGSSFTAHYEMVGTGLTGHAESVRITYDPTAVTYGQLLQVFFSVVHDPTELDYQGPDSGRQYRSAIFPRDNTQKRIASAYLAQLTAAKVFASPIVTRTEPDRGFFPAEGNHQNYLDLHPTDPYIAINDVPEVDALKKTFPALYRDQPELVPTHRASQ
jgi:peptide-methionine (S)-S-oxide reductase